MAQGLEMERNATEPTNPATGYTRVYIDTDGDLAYKRPDGSVGKLKGGGVVDLAGYDLTLAADSTLAGSLTGGGAVTVPAGATAAFARSGTAMLRGSNPAAGRVPLFGTNTDVLDGSEELSFDCALLSVSK
jgi:flagellar basal body rod protein FlgF